MQIKNNMLIKRNIPIEINIILTNDINAMYTSLRDAKNTSYHQSG